MGLILTPSPWASQPQTPVGLNENSPFARGLIGLYNPAVGLRDFSGLGNDLTNVGAATIAAGVKGRGYKPATSSYFATPDLRSLITSSTGATLMLLLQGGTTANQGIIRAGSDTVNLDHYPYSSVIYSSAFSGSRWAGGYTSLVPFTDPHAVSYIWDPNNAAGYPGIRQNGRLAGGFLSKPAFGLPSDGKIWLGSSFTTGSSWYYNGSIALAAIWNRALSADEEAQLLNTNGGVWQLFAPRVRRIWVPSASTGTTVSGTVGDAVANGSTATLYIGSVIAGTVGNAVADGSTAAVQSGATIAGSVGNAVADGATANVYQGAVIAGSVGNAVADGASATVQAGGTIAASVGNAVADGATASVYQGATVAATVGNAVADGSAATVTNALMIAGAVGDAAAAGATAAVYQGIYIGAGVGNAVADGRTASVTGEGVVVPAPGEVPAGRRRRREMLVVEIDGEDQIVYSREEAQALLDQAQEQAEEQAEEVKAKALAHPKRQLRKVLQDARGALTTPQIRVSAEIQDYASSVLEQIATLRAHTLRDIELSLRLKQIEDEQDEEDVLLLMA